MRTWRESNQQRVRHIRAAERVFRNMFRKVRQKLREEMAGAAHPENLLTIAENFSCDLGVRRALEKIYISTGVVFARANYREIIGKKSLDDDMQDDIWTRHMLDFVATRCGGRIAAITRNTYADIVNIAKKSVEKGTRGGWGAAQVAKEIAAQHGIISEWRALRIARTEVVGASNEGSFLGARETGLTLKKIWLATNDARARPDHMEEMNNVAVMMDEFFVLPDGTEMAYPGVADGPAEHVINCRCSIGFEPVEKIL